MYYTTKRSCCLMCVYLLTIISTVFLFYRVLVFVVPKLRPGLRSHVFVFVGLVVFVTPHRNVRKAYFDRRTILL